MDNCFPFLSRPFSLSRSLLMIWLDMTPTGSPGVISQWSWKSHPVDYIKMALPGLLATRGLYHSLWANSEMCHYVSLIPIVAQTVDLTITGLANKHSSNTVLSVREVGWQSLKVSLLWVPLWLLLCFNWLSVNVICVVTLFCSVLIYPWPVTLCQVEKMLPWW